jgi:hypothetical protein
LFVKTSLTSGLVALAVGRSLVLNGFDSDLFGLGLENVLHQHSLVLEDVTLGL